MLHLSFFLDSRIRKLNQISPAIILCFEKKYAFLLSSEALRLPIILISYRYSNMFYFNRWIVFVAACLLQTSGGLNYSFSVISPVLKDLFELDEVWLGAVATLGFNLGGKFLSHPNAVVIPIISKEVSVSCMHSTHRAHMIGR